MEPVIVILLLFGAFTLGAESTEARQAGNTKSVIEQQRTVEERTAALSLKSCLSGWHPVIYRDLTTPFVRKQVALPTPRESGCPDE